MKFLNPVFLLIHLAVVLLLFGTLLNAFVPPKIFAWLNFLSLAFPVLFIIHSLLILYWIFGWKRRAWIFILLSVFFYNPVRAWVNYSPKTNIQPDLKILTLNCKAMQLGKTEIKNYIQSQNADVVLLQEAVPGGEIQELDGYYRNSSPVIIGTYTKHKILADEKIVTGGNSFANATDVEIRGKIYRFINVYLEPFQLKKSMLKPSQNADVNEEKTKFLLKRMMPVFREHQSEIDAISAAVKNSPYPVFLGGDFNSVPNSYEYYQISTLLKDAFTEAGSGSGTSFHDYKFPLRIDYIFSSENQKAASYKVDRNVNISDHFPVTATFKLR